MEYVNRVTHEIRESYFSSENYIKRSSFNEDFLFEQNSFRTLKATPENLMLKIFSKEPLVACILWETNQRSHFVRKKK